MKFEELKALIDKLQGEAGYATGGNVDALVYSGLDVHIMLDEISDSLENIEATYASKIKMTFEQKDGLMQFYESDFGFKTFWICFGSGSSLYKEFSEKELMQAWLYPELIEVENG